MRKHRRRAMAALVLAAATALALSEGARAGDSPISPRLKRQIAVMEEVIDEILLESPNLLIHGTEPTFGLYVEEFGALFSLEASLVEQNWAAVSGLAFLDNLRIDTDGDRVILWRDDDQDDEEDEGEVIAELQEGEDWEAERLSRLARRERTRVRERRRYEHGKQELLDALIDYGETLTDLREDQWVAIAAFFQNSEFFRRNSISRLIMKVSVRDLRTHAADRLSREDLVARVLVEEY
jgi:hypothetical protein